MTRRPRHEGQAGPPLLTCPAPPRPRYACLDCGAPLPPLRVVRCESCAAVAWGALGWPVPSGAAPAPTPLPPAGTGEIAERCEQCSGPLDAYDRCPECASRRY